MWQFEIPVVEYIRRRPVGCSADATKTKPNQTTLNRFVSVYSTSRHVENTINSQKLGLKFELYHVQKLFIII